MPLSPQSGLKNAVSKISTILYDITSKRYDIRCQLLITNRKSHTGFRLVPTSVTLRPSVTLNGVIALILRFSLNSIALQADYVTVLKIGL